jgi:ankyrin repeat protein
MLEQNRSAFRKLLDQGVDPAEANGDGRTAMHLATMGKDRFWLDELLSRGMNPNIANATTKAPPLFDALCARLPENGDRLLTGGAHLDVEDRNGTAPLHQAAMVNDSPPVLKFLEAGADPVAVDNIGKTFQAYLFDGETRSISTRIPAASWKPVSMTTAATCLWSSSPITRRFRIA